MITAIIINEVGESHIRRYNTTDVREARNRFVDEWIAGKITWHGIDYFGPNCAVNNPAFTPEFLRKHGYQNDPPARSEKGVTIYQWSHITGPYGSDEQFVEGYFIPSRATRERNVGRPKGRKPIVHGKKVDASAE